MKSVGSTERLAVMRAELRELRFKRSLLDGEIYAKEERMMTMMTELSALMLRDIGYVKGQKKRRLVPPGDLPVQSNIRPFCKCACHSTPGMKHFGPCCGDGTPFRKPDTSADLPARAERVAVER